MDDSAGECRALIGTGNVLCGTGRYAEAHERYSRALPALGDMGARDLEGILLTNISVLKMATTDFQDTLPLLEKALGIARTLISRDPSQEEREEILTQLSAAVREVPRHGRRRGCCGASAWPVPTWRRSCRPARDATAWRRSHRGS